MKIKNYLLILLTISALSVLTSCSSSAVVQNTWRSTEIKIDGNFTDWQNHLKLLPEQKISLGFTNDDKFFYMCLVTEDRMKVMQMTRAGLITWFIPSSGSENTFGIKYPLPNKNPPREQMQNMGREMFQQGGQGGLDKIVNVMLEKQNEMQILNSDKYSLSLLPIENQDGIKAKLGYVDNKFVYELQVPLAVHSDYAFQIATMPGENMQIKFETEQTEAAAGRGAGAGMAQGGGGQMGGGGMGGMRQGAGGGNTQRFQMPEPLNYSTEVKLAQKK
ncbi:MAG: hypothetical protein Q8L04_05890 [Ignavibacteria bacterium]|nr:hypothetical protein [Ignavibacteria bacterium]